MPKISSAFVIANRKKAIALKIKREVEKFLLQQGVRLSASSPQLIITVGGDGTVLYGKKHYGSPYFAIGSRTSFICQSTLFDWKKKLPRLLRLLKTEPRLLLSSALNGKPLPLSLNEIGIRNPEPRVLSLHLSVGKKHFAFRADGMLFSTPTGSMAYCYSCGGKQMKKSGLRFQAVAIAPFLRAFSPLILPPNATCALRISGKEKAQIFIDGQKFGSFGEKDTLVVEASRKRFLFAKI